MRAEHTTSRRRHGVIAAPFGRRAPPRGYAMSLVGEFAERAALLGDPAAVAALFASAVRDLGFRYHALVEHADLARRPLPALFVHNYPRNWVERFAAARLHRVDPVQQAVAGHVGGFAWRDLPRLIPLDRAQRAMLRDARRVGLGEGFTVPLHAPGLSAASCSFVVPPGHKLPDRALMAAECLAHFAFQATRRWTSSRERPRLTARQRQCVALVAQGKTDWETARILGLGEETVTKYLNAARLRFGVARRTQLAIAALAAREIDLDEIVTWQ